MPKSIKRAANKHSRQQTTLAERVLKYSIDNENDSVVFYVFSGSSHQFLSSICRGPCSTGKQAAVEKLSKDIQKQIIELHTGKPLRSDDVDVSLGSVDVYDFLDKALELGEIGISQAERFRKIAEEIKTGGYESLLLKLAILI